MKGIGDGIGMLVGRWVVRDSCGARYSRVRETNTETIGYAVKNVMCIGRVWVCRQRDSPGVYVEWSGNVAESWRQWRG